MKSPNESVRRFLIGGVCGVAVMVTAACALECIGGGIRGEFHFPTLVGHGAEARFGSYPLAVLAQSALMFALGGMVGLATMPFAEEGKNLLRRSALHFLVTAALFSLLMVFCFDLSPDSLPHWLGFLLILYLAVWLIRYVGWWMELETLRQALGLKTIPSPLRWRESLPYLALLTVFFLLLRPLLALIDAPDVPGFTGILLPVLGYPLCALFTGLSAGRKQGFCPLIPVAAFLAFLPNLLYFSPRYHWEQGMAYAILALIANMIGAALRRKRRNRHETDQAL